MHKVLSTNVHRPRRLRSTMVALGLVVVGVALSSCGGPATPGVATGSSTTTTTAPSSTGPTRGSSVLAYSTCMRAHGVTNFPDPSASGGIDNKEAVVNALEAVSQAISNAAQRDCARLMPAGGLGGQAPTKPITVQDQQYYLRAVACMRSHGFPTFPDPVFANGGITIPNTPSVNTSSPLYDQSKALCTKLIPAGLPDSANG